MPTNTAQTKRNVPSAADQPARRSGGIVGGRLQHLTIANLITLGLLMSGLEATYAGTVLGPWNPLFKGIDHAVGTNTPGTGGFMNLQVAYLLRVDLAEPGVQLFASPRHPNYSPGSAETAGYTATNFLKNHGLQAVVNANGFYLADGSPPGYTSPEGTAMNPIGPLISNGQVVSTQDSAEYLAAYAFDANKQPTFIATNWPARSLAGAHTAVAGMYTILANGSNIGSNYFGSPIEPHGVEPRTAMGVSQDARYLYLLVIDGRQPGYSLGAYDWETAEWLRMAGAWNGINLDGGGSSCMVAMDTTGMPLPLNHDTASLAVGRERTVGAHFGIYAQPLPGFFNDIISLPTDTTATLTWTSIEPVTTQVQYGLSANLTNSTAHDSALSTNHTVLLTNLAAGTQYYFALYGTNETAAHLSPIFALKTTNYLATTALLELTSLWKYAWDSLDGVAWTTRPYDDAGWGDPSPGAFWVNSQGPNPSVTLPLGTEMPLDPNTFYPYPTYYLRTHFLFTNDVSNLTLRFQHSIDDGAVFYLNGTEIRRLRMAAPPTAITYTMLSTGFPCTGDATCTEEFSLSGPIIATNLVNGDNLLAVEVHNYRANSRDITFGLALSAVQPVAVRPEVRITRSAGVATISWDGGGYTLQEAESSQGPFADVPGPVVASPCAVPPSTATRFYRLRK